MTTGSSAAADRGPAAPPRNKMPKVAFASFMGTVIEFYDFGIYGTAAALVFASSFFPALGGRPAPSSRSQRSGSLSRLDR